MALGSCKSADLWRWKVEKSADLWRYGVKKNADLWRWKVEKVPIYGVGSEKRCIFATNITHWRNG